MKKLKLSFVAGAIALVFAVVGYQTALLVHYSAVTRIAANRDTPDTVFVFTEDAVEPASEQARTNRGLAGRSGKASSAVRTERVSGNHDKVAKEIRESIPARRVESFNFNPNTVSKEDLIRLGFTAKQAESIVHYRTKGGRFRRREDFAKSYVVTDSVYRRLEMYIDIPKLDINTADSAAFDALPGIGGYFARKMVEYREKLGGYSYPEQLLEIYHMDEEKYGKFKDLITLSSPRPYRLWSLPVDSLRRHPYINNYSAARGIVFFRENNGPEQWSVENLGKAGILSPEQVAKLSRCVIGR